ncbi:MAG: DUF2281 domain-containing protein [Tunicatimonas sp.]
MNELTIVRRIANLKPKQQEMVAAFVEFLEQKSQAASAVDKNPPLLKAGFLKGTFAMSDDFDKPLDDFKDYMH